MSDVIKLTPAEQRMFRKKFLEELAQATAIGSVHGEIVRIEGIDFPMSQIQKVQEEWRKKRIIF